jgi:galactonate dehydratase
MKITAIESLRWGEYPRLMLVQVHTDEGVVGLGETVDKIPGSEGALHGTIAPLMLGQNPLDIEGLWHFVADNIMYHGYAGAEMRALSAVEIALWDILGKVYKAPLYQLLGGKVRDRVPVYNTCIGFGPVQDYAAWHEDAGALAESLLADGIKAMKIWPFDQYSVRSHGHYISLDDVEKGLTPVRQIRERVGHAMEIGIECHFRWSRASIERIARALEPYDILFIEDVMAAVYPDEIKAFSQRTSIPVVGSELLMTRWGIREWLVKGVAQIAMTDPTWTGGVSESRRFAALAGTFGVPVVMHNVAGPVCHAVAMHLSATIHNLFFTESCRAFYKTYIPALCGWQPTVEDGTMSVPEGDGLGIDLLPEALSRDDLTRRISDGAGLAQGLRAMGDHWAKEDIR